MMPTKRELLEEREFLNSLLKSSKDFETQRDIFNRLAENKKMLDRFM